MDEGVSSPASILVVDDNPLITNVLTSLLTSEAYRVYSSKNGEEALDLLDRKNVDVIICDVMMPRMGGYEFHKVVRDRSKFCHIPFIFLTALGDEGEVFRGKASGADDYLVKPFNPKELLSIIKGKVTRSRNLRQMSEEKYDLYRKRVIHTLSHEFRTPLVAINTGTELLLDQKDAFNESKAQHLLEAVQRGGRRLEKLVNDFMILQQIEAGIAQRLHDTRAEILSGAEIVDQMMDRHREEFETSSISIEVTVLTTDSRVRVHLAQIDDILYRIIGNALKFSEKGSVVEVCAYDRSGSLVIEVRDRGIGMDIERVQEAIDVFGQIDREHLEQQGGGLGLAIASRYAAVANGKLEFSERKGGGSVVALVLPLVKDSE